MSSEAGIQKNEEEGGLSLRDSILKGLPTLLGEMFFAYGGHIHRLPNRITTYLPAGDSSPTRGSASPSYSVRISVGWVPLVLSPTTYHSCSLWLPVVNWDEVGHQTHETS